MPRSTQKCCVARPGRRLVEFCQEGESHDNRECSYLALSNDTVEYAGFVGSKFLSQRDQIASRKALELIA